MWLSRHGCLSREIRRRSKLLPITPLQDGVMAPTWGTGLGLGLGTDEGKVW